MVKKIRSYGCGRTALAHHLIHPRDKPVGVYFRSGRWTLAHHLIHPRHKAVGVHQFTPPDVMFRTACVVYSLNVPT